MVLSVMGWAALGLLCLVLLLLLAPVTVRLRYAGGGLTVWARVLFVRLKLRPRPPRAEKPEGAAAKKAPSEKEGKAKKPKKERTRREKLALARRFVGAGLAALRVASYGLWLRRVELVVPVHSAEASDTARNCGRVQAAIGGVRAMLEGRVKVHYRRLEVIPDFGGQYAGALTFSCNIVFCPGILLVAGIRFVWAFVLSRHPR